MGKNIGCIHLHPTCHGMSNDGDKILPGRKTLPKYVRLPKLLSHSGNQFTFLLHRLVYYSDWFHYIGTKLFPYWNQPSNQASKNKITGEDWCIKWTYFRKYWVNIFQQEKERLYCFSNINWVQFQEKGKKCISRWET